LPIKKRETYQAVRERRLMPLEDHQEGEQYHSGNHQDDLVVHGKEKTNSFQSSTC